MPKIHKCGEEDLWHFTSLFHARSKICYMYCGCEALQRKAIASPWRWSFRPQMSVYCSSRVVGKYLAYLRRLPEEKEIRGAISACEGQR
jgi:hypothetical protein